MVQRAGQNLQLLIEKVEILYGNRGNPKDWALRRGELVDVQKIITEVRKSLDDLKKALQQVKDDIDQINLHIAQLEGRLDAAEQAINMLDQALSTLEQRIGSAEQALTQIENAIQQINQNLGSVGNDVSALKNSVSTLNQSVSSLQQSVSSISSSLSTLTETVNAIGLSVAALQKEVETVYSVNSNPGTTQFPANSFRAIPFLTATENTRITLTSNTVFTVSKAGVYQFELEVRVNGGLSNMFPLNTAFAISIDGQTTPTTLKAGFSAATVAGATTILRLVCSERLASGATRVAYLYNQGMAAYQVASASMKIVRISA